jgi:ABC-type glycerol-3-phosphate transport system permease component
MRDDSNTFIYVVAGIIVLHFLVGFIWLIIKLSKRKEDKEN